MTEVNATLIFRGGLVVGQKKIPVTLYPPEVIIWGGRAFKHETVTPAEPWTFREVWSYTIPADQPIPEGSS